MTTIATVMVSVLIVLGIIYLAYDALANAAADWLAENDVMYPVYPWYVRFNHWLHHIDSARVENMQVEVHYFFGKSIKRVGKPICFIK